MKNGEYESLKLLELLAKEDCLPDYGQQILITHTVSKKTWPEHRHYQLSIMRTTDSNDGNPE
jgi:hypothetical protein